MPLWRYWNLLEVRVLLKAEMYQCIHLQRNDFSTARLTGRLTQKMIWGILRA